MTGQPRVTAVGFVEHGDGWLVAAGEDDADWAQNLLADPACRVTIAGRTVAAVAREVDGPERALAVRQLILKYGTPAERLGRGPTFALTPVS